MVEKNEPSGKMGYQILNEVSIFALSKKHTLYPLEHPEK